jgi:hypothetical protein
MVFKLRTKEESCRFSRRRGFRGAYGLKADH